MANKTIANATPIAYVIELVWLVVAGIVVVDPVVWVVGTVVVVVVVPAK